MGFELGGKCLAFHGPLLYEAKVLRIWDSKDKKLITPPNETTNGITEPESEMATEDCYFIHYQGWKATWDEWIGSDRIREYNEENVELKKKLIQQAKELKKDSAKQSKKRKSQLSNSHSHLNQQHLQLQQLQLQLQQVDGSDSNTENTNTTTTVSLKKPKTASSSSSNLDNTLTTSNRSSNSPHMMFDSKNWFNNNSLPKITMHIPTKLKSVLVNDWEYVTKDKKICKLPSKLSAGEIIDKFESECSGILDSPTGQSQLSEYCNGLRLYFEKSLPVLLLYRLERLQYDELKSKEDLLHKYGSIHLLRLVSILPELISNTTMDTQSCQLIVRQTETFLEWLLLRNQALHLFPIDSDDFYVNTSSQYEGVALGL
ncbi:hypothetical protein Kpol_1006p12 [Vanderwaltozyma polyspora DSM 70294]|uniref:Chromatin modification-related protein EAF3 n=1 Tax=Vanderwaltozyma polyspora (strain ATCC 22028 / DSM 70294 / BCRC 21397 / CBS 2163 / NBRC 10782 / NRRL Y-8283 / UCD 57-17) TaxID=436907 RepID=A7TQ48_VANPO|nr:uncharacterized protein Kpol_1006p12 [Vanderwaltozyma polyspora DSM 70294]EDO15616.1 hypothetical protein Kpol_1006p12 [Vanderwaltozyma polyspora DSM 70294]